MLVGAFAVAHTPQLLIRPETEDRALVLRVHAAMARVKERLEALRPDAIAMIAGDHVEAFFLDAVPALAVYVGRECAGTFGPYRYRFDIHEPLARAVVEQGIERGFDLLYTQDAKLDYAFYVPLHFVMPEPARPIVPLHVNVYLPPQPTPRPLPRLGPGPRRDPARAPGARRAHRLGRHVPLPGHRPLRLARVRLRPRAARPAGRGRGRELARVTGEELDKRGNIELRTWITLLGAVGDARARRVLLRALLAPRQRGGGVAGLSPDERGRALPLPAVGAYPLNRCLYALKSDREFAERFLADPARPPARWD